MNIPAWLVVLSCVGLGAIGTLSVLSLAGLCVYSVAHSQLRTEFDEMKAIVGKFLEGFEEVPGDGNPGIDGGSDGEPGDGFGGCNGCDCFGPYCKKDEQGGGFKLN